MCEWYGDIGTTTRKKEWEQNEKSRKIERQHFSKILNTERQRGSDIDSPSKRNIAAPVDIILPTSIGSN